MTLSRNIKLVGICVAILATAFLLIGARIAFGNVATTVSGNANLSGTYRYYNFFATSTNQRVVSGSTYYGTTTSSGTSTAITSWVDSNGTVDTGAFNTTGARSVSVVFKRGDATGTGNSGSTNFRVQVTYDGTNWFYWGNWKENASSTIGFTPTSPSGTSFVLTSTSTVIATMNLTNDAPKAIRCIALRTTDGDSYCAAAATW